MEISQKLVCHKCENLIDQGFEAAAENNIEIEMEIHKKLKENLSSCPESYKGKHRGMVGYIDCCLSFNMGLTSLLYKKIKIYEEEHLYEKMPRWAKNLMDKFMKVV